MKSSIFRALFLAALLLPINGTGQGPDSVFEEYDLDGDEVIDRIEFGMSAVAQKAREDGREEIIGKRFNRLDLNKDNAVSREEFHTVVPTDEPEETDEIFTKADRNEDGKLNQLEYFQASGAIGKLSDSGVEFRSADGDRDGFVSQTEWASVRREGNDPDEMIDGIPGRVRETFRRADKDRDRKLSSSEFGRTEFGKRLRERGGRDIVEVFFARLNTNGDDFLTLEEFSAAAGPPRPGMRKGKKGR
ncbi:MAG: EF-hand domain-containing protein [Verrucomicrobiales bacterium]|nr:EF-hand domain-containing protein [Verrucomicrobiales bacterium]